MSLQWRTQKYFECIQCDNKFKLCRRWVQLWSCHQVGEIQFRLELEIFPPKYFLYYFIVINTILVVVFHDVTERKRRNSYAIKNYIVWNICHLKSFKVLPFKITNNMTPHACLIDALTIIKELHSCIIISMNRYHPMKTRSKLHGGSSLKSRFVSLHYMRAQLWPTHHLFNLVFSICMSCHICYAVHAGLLIDHFKTFKYYQYRFLLLRPLSVLFRFFFAKKI